MEILIMLATVILPLLIGYILGKNRDSNQIVFNKKLEIYSDIVYHLNSGKYLRFNLDISVKELKVLTEQVVSLQVNESDEVKTHPLAEKITKVENQVRLINYTDELVKLFAPARLIGSREVADELREYFSLFTEYYSVNEKEDQSVLVKKISKSVMELEQLMRKDLGRFRIFSKLDILWHIQKDK